MHFSYSILIFVYNQFSIIFLSTRAYEQGILVTQNTIPNAKLNKNVSAGQTIVTTPRSTETNQ